MQIVNFLLIFIISFSAIAAPANRTLNNQISEVEELSRLVNQKCLNNADAGSVIITVRGRTHTCKEMVFITDALQDKIDRQVAALEVCEDNQVTPAGTQLASDVARATGRLGGACPAPVPSEAQCLLQFGCSVYSIVNPLAGLLAAGSRALTGQKNACLSQGAGTAQACLLNMMKGIFDSIWGTLKTVWQLAKIPFVKFGELVGLVKKSERATSEKAMAAQQAGPGFIKRFIAHPIDTMKELGSMIYRSLKEAAMSSYGCEEWSGTPFRSNCNKPMSNWKCASCQQKTQLICGIGGLAVGEIGTALLTGGVAAGGKFAVRAVVGVVGRTKTAASTAAFAARVAKIPKVNATLVAASRTVAVTAKGAGRILTATERRAIASWRAVESSAAGRAIQRAANTRVGTAARAEATRIAQGIRSDVKILSTPITAYLGALENATTLGFRSVDNVLAGTSRAATGATAVTTAVRIEERAVSASGVPITAPRAITVADDAAAAVSVEQRAVSASGVPITAPRAITVTDDAAAAVTVEQRAVSASGVPITAPRPRIQGASRVDDFAETLPTPRTPVTPARTPATAAPSRTPSSVTVWGDVERVSARETLDAKNIRDYENMGFNEQVAANLSDKERVFIFEQISGVRVTEVEAKKLVELHQQGAGFGAYSLGDLRAKADGISAILVSNGVSDTNQISRVVNLSLRQGVLGKSVAVAERPGFFQRIKGLFQKRADAPSAPPGVAVADDLADAARRYRETGEEVLGANPAGSLNATDTFGPNRFRGSIDDLVASRAFREQGPYGNVDRSLWWDEIVIEGNMSLSPLRGMYGKDVQTRRAIYWPKDQIEASAASSAQYVTNFSRNRIAVNQVLKDGKWVDESIEVIVRDSKTGADVPLYYVNQNGKMVPSKTFKGQSLTDACIKCHQHPSNPGVFTAFPYKTAGDLSGLHYGYKSFAQRIVQADGRAPIAPRVREVAELPNGQLPTRADLIANRDANLAKSGKIGKYDDDKRLKAAEDAIGYRFDINNPDRAIALANRKKRTAVTKSHEVAGGKTYGQHSQAELREKYRILREGGFTKDEADVLIRKGITGSADEYPRGTQVDFETGRNAEIDLRTTSTKIGNAANMNNTEKAAEFVDAYRAQARTAADGFANEASRTRSPQFVAASWRFFAKAGDPTEAVQMMKVGVQQYGMNKPAILVSVDQELVRVNGLLAKTPNNPALKIERDAYLQIRTNLVPESSAAAAAPATPATARAPSPTATSATPAPQAPTPAPAAPPVALSPLEKAEEAASKMNAGQAAQKGMELMRAKQYDEAVIYLRRGIKTPDMTDPYFRNALQSGLYSDGKAAKTLLEGSFEGLSQEDRIKRLNSFVSNMFENGLYKDSNPNFKRNLRDFLDDLEDQKYLLTGENSSASQFLTENMKALHDMKRYLSDVPRTERTTEALSLPTRVPAPDLTAVKEAAAKLPKSQKASMEGSQYRLKKQYDEASVFYKRASREVGDRDYSDAIENSLMGNGQVAKEMFREITQDVSKKRFDNYDEVMEMLRRMDVHQRSAKTSLGFVQIRIQRRNLREALQEIKPDDLSFANQKLYKDIMDRGLFK